MGADPASAAPPPQRPRSSSGSALRGLAPGGGGGPRLRRWSRESSEPSEPGEPSEPSSEGGSGERPEAAEGARRSHSGVTQGGAPGPSAGLGLTRRLEDDALCAARPPGLRKPRRKQGQGGWFAVPGRLRIVWGLFRRKMCDPLSTDAGRLD